jgi:probable phosphoglycerate mutase
LTERGREEARAVGGRLAGRRFALVLSSPSARALETCRLAGLGARARVDGDLHEWDYGTFEGLTTAQIQVRHPGWTIWTGEVPQGETLADVGARADRVLAAVRSAGGNVAIFSHGHFLRVLAARWVELDPSAGAVLALDPGTISLLGHEHARPVVREWNAGCEPPEPGANRTRGHR